MSNETDLDRRDELALKAQEFKPFTSIEDNKEQDMQQDNGWFERGEFPPAGTVCAALLGILPSANCKIIAKSEQQIVVEWVIYKGWVKGRW
jgi:hypothetical protein